MSLDPYLFFRTPPFLERVTHVDHLVSDITRFFDAFVSDGAVYLEAHRPVRESGGPPDTDDDLVAEFALATLPEVSPRSMICPSMLQNTWLKKAAGGGEGAGIKQDPGRKKDGRIHPLIQSSRCTGGRYGVERDRDDGSWFPHVCHLHRRGRRHLISTVESGGSARLPD